ncbi:PQQ-dependent sugar dehydrogenase [Pectobacterium atrosepticum]|uniref:PQQ-dependent sugar dehydrogenase n=1 Tax=Pectobacterium atrosepticum TaxID=29471 RepID=UPI00049A527B|nr:PQQ-dependent sugar dehydrogenase [Pectobacterium atrosepticum]GKV85021.1 aldose dehydrogenase [Pectobacterium carotovorum subsp. carotovorum]AIA71507.1 oxidoreductase [Pectobacterium atrosepticum]AIK13688.1 putative exported protein [Pectobacterium atrosepticum]ATY90568.1 PQQ-dependent sugar dehydrogenase [Pectobacterium atrosepticum]KFX16211.1 oxidoreductase [Pectobacterium atrosepticum]
MSACLMPRNSASHTVLRRFSAAPYWLLLSATLLFSSQLLAAEPKVTELQDKLDHPWSLAFLPEEQGILITERAGNLRLWKAGSALSAPIAGVPKVYAKSQGGLLEVALSPDFAQNRRIYLSFAEEGSDGKAGTAVGYGKLSEDNKRLENFTVFFRQEPKLSTGNHFGGKLAFDRQGHLFIALGENNERPTAQDLDKLQGKIVRLTVDGKVPSDNPFVNTPNARSDIWSYGHRNPQGLAINPWSGVLWENEHGPKGGDEINIPKAGENYGWPIATHGINYSGLQIPEAKGKEIAGMANPDFYWEKSPGISGMAFYNSDRFPQWKNSVFIGALAEKNLIRLTLDGDKVASQERLLNDRGERIRDVRLGPDGYLYLLTDHDNGKLLKVGLE